MIGDLVDLAAIERGTLKLAQGHVEIGAVIEEAFGMIRPDLEHLGMRVDGLPVRETLAVAADHHRLVQVFVNLFQNVLRYGASGGVLGVCVGPQVEPAQAPAGNRCKCAQSLVDVTVWDAGPGIPPEKREEIFDAFVPASDGNGKNKGKGLGLGLPLSRQLVRTMNGDLWASESRYGGAAFRLQLPAADHSADQKFDADFARQGDGP
jgi:signal transduction histidine kinase